MARDHRAGGQVEPRAARLGELLRRWLSHQSVSGARQLHSRAVAPVAALQIQAQATQGRDLSTPAPLRALRPRTPDRAGVQRAVGEGVTSCPRAGSLGRHPRTGRLASAVGKVRPYSRADQDQIGRVWSVRAETRGQTRQEPPGNYLPPGPHPVLHAEPKRKLQGWDAHREITAEAQPYVSARTNAANTTSHNQ